MIIELPEDNLRFLIREENLIHLDDLIKNAYFVRLNYYLKQFIFFNF